MGLFICLVKNNVLKLNYQIKLYIFEKGGENMRKIFKHVISLAIVAMLMVPVLAIPASAQTASPTSSDLFGKDFIEDNVELSSSDPRAIVGRIINVALGLLGVIAVAIILMGGFKWMTAGGNEDKVSEAKKLLGAGVIGLAIVLAAWAVANWVIDAIYEATMAA